MTEGSESKDEGSARLLFNRTTTKNTSSSYSQTSMEDVSQEIESVRGGEERSTLFLENSTRRCTGLASQVKEGVSSCSLGHQ